MSQREQLLTATITPLTRLPRIEKVAPDTAVEDLKANIAQLSELHAKLHFMLNELEELIGVKPLE